MTAEFAPRRGAPRIIIAAIALSAVVGLTVAAWSRPALWLDESQSVALARTSLWRIPHGLRIDGAPPLYYLCLHIWMRMFGDGDTALRSLSVLFFAAFMATVALLALRVANRWAAFAAVALVAGNPFVIRYASETRMYSLVMFEVAVGLLLAEAVWRSGSRRVGAGLAVTVAALLYTHYWGLYLLGSAALLLLAVALHGARSGDPARTLPRCRARLLLACLAGGVVLWLPWVPTFRFQAAHTGTPWSTPASLIGAFGTAIHSGRARSGWGWAVSGAIVGLAIVGAIRSGRGRGELLTSRRLGALFLVGTATAWIGADVSHSAFTARYTAVLFPMLVLAAALGVATLSRPRATAALVAIVWLVGIGVSVQQVGEPRTRAPLFAAALSERARPGDQIVYCPDQLGPALDRLLRRSGVAVQSRTYPAGSTPAEVDWIDYAARYERAASLTSGAAAADELDTAAGPTHHVWLVLSRTYPPTQPACGVLFRALGKRRPAHTQVIDDAPGASDHDVLWRFDPGMTKPVTPTDGSATLRRATSVS